MQLTRTSFFVSLYIHAYYWFGRPRPGSLGNIHELYEENSDPLFWIQKQKQIETSNQRISPIIGISNSYGVVIDNAEMKGHGDFTLVGANGCNKLSVINSTFVGYENATIVESEGNLDSTLVASNKITVNEGDLKMSTKTANFTAIKAKGSVVDSSVKDNKIDGFDTVTLIESGGDVANSIASGNEIVSKEFAELLSRLEQEVERCNFSDEEKTSIDQHIASLRSATNHNSRTETYNNFMSFLANHISVYGPIYASAQMLFPHL
ncbi:hypothetical protein ACPV5J_19165 [Vibrio rotiferianus]|uniref:hypothetical protein n=1 Tax=Vibrio rotiferianus TaxID=190895 RepID=UPI00406A3708